MAGKSPDPMGYRRHPARIYVVEKSPVYGVFTPAAYPDIGGNQERIKRGLNPLFILDCI
jgi:hypothetical protein